MGFLVSMKENRVLQLPLSVQRYFKNTHTAAAKMASVGKTVAKISRRGCFSADSVVNIKTITGEVVLRPLHSMSLGDLVESVDEQSGQRVYSKIYYIEHEQQGSRSHLLRILYRDSFNKTESLGISDRHLIYVTKKGQPTLHTPLQDPIMAMEVMEGDVIWIMQNGKLTPSKVTGG